MFPMVRFDLKDGRSLVASCEAASRQVDALFVRRPTLLFISDDRCERLAFDELKACEIVEPRAQLQGPMSIFDFVTVCDEADCAVAG